jgi:hypothetical protein
VQREVMRLAERDQVREIVFSTVRDLEDVMHVEVRRSTTWHGASMSVAREHLSPHSGRDPLPRAHDHVVVDRTDNATIALCALDRRW